MPTLRQIFFQSRVKAREGRGIWRLMVVTLFALGLIIIFLTHQEREERMGPVLPNVLARFEKELERSRFADFDNEVGAKNGELIVPNTVHFVVFNDPFIDFIHFVCILAVMRNQRPAKIYFHTNVDAFQGQYWTRLVSLKQFTDVLVIRKTEMPTTIFNQTIQPKWHVYHGGDVARMRLLMEYGGIYLDTDSYIVRSLDPFRKFEMAVAWDRNSAYFGNQIIVAHKEARFLLLWYYSYDGAYDKKQWYHNAGYLPVTVVLRKRPDLVHAVKRLFGHDCCMYKVLEEYWPGWREQYALHLFARHTHLVKNISDEATFPIDFDEYNIQKYPITLREMVNEVLDYEKSLRRTKT